MKFEKEKKDTIILYILEKIEQGDRSISKTAAEAFSVNQNTIHTYINELVSKNIIKRSKRGEYALIETEKIYELNRKNGDLDTDTYAYNRYFSHHISQLSENIQSIWSYVFSEMINNVMDHSMAEHVKIIITQDFLNTNVSISDDGIGIFRKIKEYFGYTDLDDAICELFKGKLTTDSENHSGEGIFFSSKMVDDFRIISDGRVFSNNRYDNSLLDLERNIERGTRVVMKLSNHTKKEPQEIFDLYANVDGGFAKTRIPMKNIFDTSPVSRSQAKRVCNRLENFKEVILDFEDIKWMGQGFAHQLFAIYAKGHPDIKIEPVNMSKDVEKMYRHVLG